MQREIDRMEGKGRWDKERTKGKREGREKGQECFEPGVKE